MTSVCFCNAAVSFRCGLRSGSGGSLLFPSARVIAGLNLVSPGARKLQSPPTQTTASLLCLCWSRSSVSCCPTLSSCSFVRPWLWMVQKTGTRYGPRMHTLKTRPGTTGVSWMMSSGPMRDLFKMMATPPVAWLGPSEATTLNWAVSCGNRVWKSSSPPCVSCKSSA